jgi:two-component system chemotaxis response regulator CheB
MSGTSPVADRLVVIVASAGGLGSFVQVLAALPASFPAPVLVMQHLPAGGHVALAHILSVRTGLPVGYADSGTAPRPGHVYVAPAGQHLLVGPDRRLMLADTAPIHYARPSADLLLTSAASAYGLDLIAVVLSGGRRDGADGAEGILRVHQAGGTVVVQDPATCLRSGMPATVIAAGAADYVLRPAHITPLLVSLTTLDCPTWSGGSTRPLLAG